MDQLVDDALSYLEKTKERIQESEAGNKEEMTQAIDTEIQSLQSTKENLAGLNEESETKEIQDVMRRVKHSWQTARFAVQKQIHALAGLKVANVLRKSEHLAEKLEKFKARLQAEGKDTSNLNVEKFEAKIEDAKELYNEAVKLRQQAMSETGDAKKDLLKQATEKLRESHKKVQEAHQLLREIIKRLRELAGKPLSELDTSKVEEVTDTEAEIDETSDEAAGNETAEKLTGTEETGNETVV